MTRLEAAKGDLAAEISVDGESITVNGTAVNALVGQSSETRQMQTSGFRPDLQLDAWVVATEAMAAVKAKYPVIARGNKYFIDSIEPMCERGEPYGYHFKLASK